MVLIRVLATTAAVAALLASGPALAWDYDEQQADGGGQLIGAWEDVDSGYELALECDDIFTDPDLYIFTPDTYEQTTSYADSVPLTISVDGNPQADLTAGFEDSNGQLAVSAYADDNDGLDALIEAMRNARSSIQIQYFDTTLSFGVDNVAESIGKLVETCKSME